MDSRTALQSKVQSYSMSRRPTILLGVCKHEAAAGTPHLVGLLSKFADVRTIVTTAARQVLPGTGGDAALTDEAEWYGWQKVLPRHDMAVLWMSSLVASRTSTTRCLLRSRHAAQLAALE